MKGKKGQEKIPYKKKKIKCENCKKLYRNTMIYKDKLICRKCYKKEVHILKGFPMPHITLEEALDKVYYIKGYRSKGKKSVGLVSCMSFPQVLIGHKIKVYLAD
jgi:hypothetical protein